MAAMKNTYLRFSAAIAAFLLTVGFNRAADSFDPIGHGQHASVDAKIASANCTSPCVLV